MAVTARDWEIRGSPALHVLKGGSCVRRLPARCAAVGIPESLQTSHPSRAAVPSDQQARDPSHFCAARAGAG